MNQEKYYTLEDFLNIVETLRSENGCPWDRKQTHKSLKPCMMEEAAELVSSIRIYDTTGNAENMREELGDILLQVVMHSQIAKEEGLFTFGDVVQEVSAKMIRRHPHVFMEARTDGTEGVYKNWDEIKRQEKEGKEWIESPLREIPKELPALTRASKVLKKADKLYGAGKQYGNCGAALEESVRRLSGMEPDMEDAALEEVLGDMLVSLSDIARRYRVSQEQVLTDRVENLIDRYEPSKKP